MFPGGEEFFKKILAEAPDKPGLVILDAVTGPGCFAVILSRAGHRVMGIDSAPRYWIKPDPMPQKPVSPPQFMRMDGHDFSFGDQRFDLIQSRNLTWTLTDPLSVFYQWRRTLFMVSALRWEHSGLAA